MSMGSATPFICRLLWSVRRKAGSGTPSEPCDCGPPGEEPAGPGGAGAGGAGEPATVMSRSCFSTTAAKEGGGCMREVSGLPPHTNASHGCHPMNTRHVLGTLARY